MTAVFAWICAAIAASATLGAAYFFDKSAEEGIARARSEAASANALAAQAHERAAKAEERAERDRLERMKIEAAIAKEVAARRLTDEQAAIVASSLRGKVTTIYLYALSDIEARTYAFQISNALQAAQIDVHLMLSGSKDAPEFPDRFATSISITGLTVVQDNNQHDVVDVVFKAFQDAGVSINATWVEKKLPGVINGRWVDDGGFHTPAIFVGLKPSPFSARPFDEKSQP